MSVHTWDSDTQSGRKKIFYIAGGSLQDREISRQEAMRSGSYLARHYLDDILDHVEIVEGGSLILVIYYGHAWPDLELVSRHRESYGTVPFEIYSPVEERDGASIRTVYEVDGTGILRGRAEHVLDSRGELLSETRMTAEGKPLGRTEYIYNDAGELVLTREYGPDGELYDEIPSDPDGADHELC